MILSSLLLSAVLEAEAADQPAGAAAGSTAGTEEKKKNKNKDKDTNGDGKKNEDGEDSKDAGNDGKKKDAPTVKVGGLIFAHYGYDLTEGANSANSFDLDRAYVSASSSMTKRLAAKITLDAGRLSDQAADTKIRVFIKNAWLEASNGDEMKARFGVVDTGYISYTEQFVGGRYIAKFLGDHEGVLSTADIGINVQGKVADGLFDYHAAIINGEGYSSPEVDAGKTAQGRATVDPLAKAKGLALPITGFVSYSLPAKGAEGVLVYAGALGFKIPNLVVWAEYLGESTGGVSAGGFSGIVSPRLDDVGGILLRVDRWDPNAKTDGDSVLSIIGGINHDFLEKTSVSLTYERAQDEAGNAEHGVFVRMQAGF